MKTLSVLISGAPVGDNLRDLEVEPATSAGDILRALNLQGYLLSKEGSAQAFASEEVIYDQIGDGDKLRAAPIAEVGNGLRALLQFLGLIPPDPPKTGTALPRRLPVQRTAARVQARAVPPTTSRQRVARDKRCLWELRGWRRTGSRLIGAYRTPRGSCCGEIRLSRGRPEFYITNPPTALLKGPHKPCFHARGNGTYFVHFGISSPEIDAGIIGIEKLLVKAL